MGNNGGEQKRWCPGQEHVEAEDWGSLPQRPGLPPPNRAFWPFQLGHQSWFPNTKLLPLSRMPSGLPVQPEQLQWHALYLNPSGCTTQPVYVIVGYRFSAALWEIADTWGWQRQKSKDPLGCFSFPLLLGPALDWDPFFQIFASCLAACHRSISLLQSSSLQKYLLYII